MNRMKYRVGQLVINQKLGLGKVLEVKGGNVTVFFKDQTDNPRIINVNVVPMAIPKEQSDPSLDNPHLLRKHKQPLAASKKRAAKPSAKPAATKAKPSRSKKHTRARPASDAD